MDATRSATSMRDILRKMIHMIMEKIVIVVEENDIVHVLIVLRLIKTNLIHNSNPTDLTHLDVSNFFENTDGKNDHLIGDENIHIN